MKKFLKPDALNPGDVIRIVASSSPFEKEAFLAGVSILRQWGFTCRYDKGIFARDPYLAGSDDRRFKELVSALRDPQAKAILFARGGYGSMRLLSHLDRVKITGKPKIILGYSDITSLLTYFQNRLGWLTYYGPVVAKDLGKKTEALTLASLHKTLTSLEPLGALWFPGMRFLKAGRSQGKLVGGCLSLLVAGLGTPYEINTDDAILFLEDTHEKPYSIDRMLTHLKLAGKFKKCRGLVFGSLDGPNPDEHYQETILDALGNFTGPILYGLPAGHSKPKITVPLGGLVHLDSHKKLLKFSE